MRLICGEVRVKVVVIAMSSVPELILFAIGKSVSFSMVNTLMAVRNLKMTFRGKLTFLHPSLAVFLYSLTIIYLH